MYKNSRYLVFDSEIGRLCAFNCTTVSSVSSVAYETCLLTDEDKVNTMYADGYLNGGSRVTLLP